MNRRLGGDASLNAPIREDGDSGEWQDWLVDDPPTRKRTGRRARRATTAARRWATALDVLNDRERRIFEARRLADEPITLEDLGAEFGVSRERVRQIEVRAFEKVQKAVKNRVAAMEQPPQAAAIAARSVLRRRHQVSITSWPGQKPGHFVFATRFLTFGCHCPAKSGQCLLMTDRPPAGDDTNPAPRPETLP